MSTLKGLFHEVEVESVPAGPGGEEDAEEPVKINIKRTISALQRWNGNLKTGDQGTQRGYYALSFYSLFFSIFTYVVIQQLQVENQYKVDTVVRHTLLGQDEALASVTTHGDFFDYLLADFDGDTGQFDADSWPNGGILGTLFNDELYNGWAVLPADLGMLYQYNKLIGGVLITQKRGRVEPCKPSAYKLFYNKCYDKTNFMEAEPCGAKPGSYASCKLVNQSSTRANKECAAKDKKLELDTSQTEEYEQYLQDVEASKFGDRLTLEDPKLPYRNLVKDSFEYRYDNYGYSAWLSLAD